MAKSKKNIKNIVSKFGSLSLDLSKAIEFPNGLIGISSASKFVLLNCPVEKFKSFKLLQSIDSDDLTFMVLPIEVTINSYYNAHNIRVDDVLKSLNIEIDDAVVLLIVSAKMIDDVKRLIVNTKAPIFIDTKLMRGTQYVFTNGDLDMQKLL